MGNFYTEDRSSLVQPALAKNPKKKWAWISIFSIVLILLILFGYFGYNKIKYSNNVELMKNAHIIFVKCAKECPFEETWIDYENGMGFFDNEELREIYDGVEFVYNSDRYCLNLCIAKSFKDTGLDKDEPEEISNNLQKTYITCGTQKSTKENILECYDNSLNNYSKEEIQNVKITPLNYIPKKINVSNLMCSESGINFNYQSSEDFEKISIMVSSIGSSKGFNFLFDEIGREGEISIPKSDYYNPNGDKYNSFEKIDSVMIDFLFNESEYPEWKFKETLMLDC